jgi:hypothetical protein
MLAIHTTGFSRFSNNPYAAGVKSLFIRYLSQNKGAVAPALFISNWQLFNIASCVYATAFNMRDVIGSERNEKYKTFECSQMRQ